MKLLFVVSGGDAPGINAALYAGTVRAEHHGDQVFGAVGGFPGVIAGQFVPLRARDLLPWIAMAGTLLASSREPVLAAEAGRAGLAAALARHQIDAIVLFGGDGTLRHIPPLLADMGIACIGIPTTIDNDVQGTELTLGFDSACNFAYSLIDGIRATGSALPGRIFTLETLGGSTGHLALEIARGAAADIVLVPEYDYDSGHVASRLLGAIAARGQTLMVYTEGLPRKSVLLEQIPQLTGIRVRSTHLGHAQRGGTPSHRDRALAAELIECAYAALRGGTRSGVTIVQAGQVELHDGVLRSGAPKLPDRDLYLTLNGLA